MTPNLTHVALHVRDLDACIGFYRDFCGMEIVHQRDDGGTRVVWLAEPGREAEFIFVLLPGGPGRDQGEGDFGHFGFALDSKAAVDAVADEGAGRWLPRLAAAAGALPRRLLLRPHGPRWQLSSSSAMASPLDRGPRMRHVQGTTSSPIG